MVEDGLSQGTILSMYQDTRGFLWLGTEDGLNRFDGYEFVHYGHQSNLNGRSVHAITESKNGDLWVGTNDALNVLKKNSESFHSYTHINTPTLANSNIQSLLFDDEQTLWIGTEQGLYKKQVDGGIEKVIPQPPIMNFATLHIISITKIRPKTLWLGTSRGVIEYDIKQNQTKIIQLNNNPTPPKIRAIFKNSKDDIWVATYGSGLFQVTQKNQLINHYKSPEIIENKIFDIAEDSKGRMWFGMDSKGVEIFEYDKGFHLLTHDPVDGQSLSGNAIESIISSNTGDIWVGTTRTGLNQHRLITENFIHMKNRANDPLKLLGNDVRAMGVDSHDRLWMGVYGEGWTILDTAKQTTYYLTQKDGLKGVHQQAMTVDGDNFVWTFSEVGMTKIKVKDLQVVESFTRDNSQLIGGDIIAAQKDNNGNLWLGHWGLGLSKFNIKNNTFTNYQQDNSDLPSNVISNLILSPTGELWISTQKGLTQFIPSTGKFNNYPLFEDGRNHYFHDMLLADNGLMWLSTSNGIRRFDTLTKTYLPQKPQEVLREEVIYKLLTDQQNYFWASSNKGIFRLNEDLSLGVNFHTEDGIQGKEFNGGVGVNLPNGVLAFGGVNGASIFKPNGILANKNKIEFSKLLIQRESVTELKTFNTNVDHLDLPSDTLSVAISLSVLGFDSASKIRYRYRKAGSNWIAINNNQVTIPITHFGSDLYEFSSTDSFGEWLPSKSSLVISVPTPWYSHTIMLLLYLLASLLLLFFLYKLRIQKLNNKSKELEFKVQKRTAELARSHKQISYQAEKLRLAAEQKTQLYETISHELRTPITLIMGPAKQLSEQVNDKTLSSTAKLIERNSTRLNRLVNQLLDLSRSESITYNAINSHIDLSVIIRQLLELFKPYASDAGISLSLDCQENLMVTMNYDDADKMLSNLISNAIKYSQSGDTISISMTKVNHMVTIQVTDTGIGIAHKHLDNIFTRFYRVNAEQTATIEGSGIGLSIVKSIVDKANGIIKVTSQLNVGTTFTIELPLFDSKTKPQQLKVSPDESNNLIKAQETNIQQDKPHLLLIDDNDDILTYVSSLLVNSYKISTAKNGEKGIEMAKANIPDIIISDIMMPGISGLALLETLKNDELTNHIPIVMLTAKGGSKIEGLKLRADDYIAKPFSPEELSFRLRNLLAARDKIKEKFAHEFINQASDAPKTIGIKSTFIDKLDNIIAQHYQNSSFSVSELAKEAAVGERQLLRKIKAETNMGAKEYIRVFRLQKSATLLQLGKTASFTSTEVGFSSLAYFSSCFKAFYGETPSQFASRKP
jgi:signal transduction histidine kinase/ligand-binding sensor domain-containing protein/DNA-binding response OmpR family regulator